MMAKIKKRTRTVSGAFGCFASAAVAADDDVGVPAGILTPAAPPPVDDGNTPTRRRRGVRRALFALFRRRSGNEEDRTSSPEYSDDLPSSSSSSPPGTSSAFSANISDENFGMETAAAPDRNSASPAAATSLNSSSSSSSSPAFDVGGRNHPSAAPVNGSYCRTAGMCLLIGISVTVMVMHGRIAAIVLTSAWLCILAHIRRKSVPSVRDATASAPAGRRWRTTLQQFAATGKKNVGVSHPPRKQR